MSVTTVNLIVFLVLLVHGIGHFQGVAGSLGVKINKSFSKGSWLLGKVSPAFNMRIALVLFLITGVLGILTAISFKGFILSNSNWQTLALITAIFSTVCLVVYPRGFAMFFNKIGAIIVNLLIYYSILFNGEWPSVAFYS